MSRDTSTQSPSTYRPPPRRRPDLHQRCKFTQNCQPVNLIVFPSTCKFVTLQQCPSPFIVIISLIVPSSLLLLFTSKKLSLIDTLVIMIGPCIGKSQ